jgi:hypothetical protein
MKYLVKCPHCNQIYKCEGQVSVKGLQYITDYNDNVTEKCLVCEQKMQPEVIKTEDWIANLFFKVKGN